MGKVVFAVVVAPVAYFIGAAVLHYVVLREGPVPSDAYPRPGAVYSSEVEGLEAHVISEENGHDLKRVRVRPGALGPPEHVHLELAEDFHLLEGELVVVLNGTERIVTAGEWARVPPQTPHRFFNRSNLPAVYELTAPKEHTRFTSQLYGFTNEHGPLVEHPTRALLQMSRFRYDTWRPAISIAFQRALYFSIEPTARLLGYERYYSEYVPQVVGVESSE